MTKSLTQWLDWLEQLHPAEIDMGLERISGVLQRADLQRNLPVLITVAGTNGKGSVVEYLSRSYHSADYKVGSYTSPHLHQFNERVCIDAEPVSDDMLCEGFAAIEQARDQTSLTYFEFTTLVAMWIFLQQRVDVAVLEVGLGGRLDAVNCWDTDCAIITSIAVDHEAWLGSDREVIAYEKAGIARAGVPLVVGEADRPHSIDAHALELGARSFFIGRDFDFLADQCDGSLACRLPDDGQLLLPAPGLPGLHQQGNACVAATALHLLRSRLPISDDAIRTGISAARVVGRMQQINWQNRQVILDVAHNPAAALMLARSLREQQPGLKFIAVFALMQDKDFLGVVEPLAPFVGTWFCSDLAVDRALPAKEAAKQLILHYPRTEVSTFGSVADAIDAALAAPTVMPGDGDESDAAILVFGSFFTVADALQHLHTVSG